MSDHQRVQPMRQAKLLRVPNVDSDIEHQLVFPKGSSSSSSSSSSSNSDRGSSRSPENDDFKDDDVYVSGGSIVSAAGSDSSSLSHDICAPQPQPKKHWRTAVHSQGERVFDADAMSSDGCPLHMLREG